MDLIDERNYLLNIMEAHNETGTDYETLIQDRLDEIYTQLENAWKNNTYAHENYPQLVHVLDFPVFSFDKKKKYVLIYKNTRKIKPLGE